MTTLEWDKTGERRIRTGTDRGVLHVQGGDIVAWNGLTAVTEGSIGGDVTPYYLDGVKYMDYVSNSDFKATLEALMYPDEFEVCEGTAQVAVGLSIVSQRRKRFDLSYRTLVVNDTDEEHYELHLLYNCTATISEKAYKTIADQTEPTPFSWDITTVPEFIDGFVPTAHLILDSRDIDLSGLEDILYGTDDSDPAWPLMADVVTYASSPAPGTYTVDLGAIVVAGVESISGPFVLQEPDTATFAGMPYKTPTGGFAPLTVKYGDGDNNFNWTPPTGATVDSIQYVILAYREGVVTPADGGMSGWLPSTPTYSPFLSLESIERGEAYAFPATVGPTTWFEDPDHPVVEQFLDETDINAVILSDHPLNVFISVDNSNELTAVEKCAYLAARVTYTIS